MVSEDPWRSGKDTPAPLSLGRPFCGRGGAVSAPVRHRFIFPGGGLGAQVQGAGAFGGQGRPGDERRNPVQLSSCLLLPVSAPPGPAPLTFV
jgi:hypothetical protein